MQHNPHRVMPFDLHFELRLEERQSDRVFVSVVLAPLDPEGAHVDGVGVQMVDRSGEPLGARLVLPLSGRVQQPVVTTVEVRARGPVPSGARVLGVAWQGPDQQEATCPCDPGTQLGVHMRGQKRISLPEEERPLRSLDRAERDVIARLMPWVDEPRIPVSHRPGVLENPPPPVEDVADHLAEQFGLDEEDAALLKELLGED